MSTQVILVNEKDEPRGEMEKMEAHQRGELHRAFSVFIFNTKGELLLQRRAQSKYHSGGLWTNTCCSHPSPGETIPDAANRRLQEEMGMRCDMDFAFSFIYRAELDGGLTEHEFDHVMLGYSDVVPQLNPDEADEYRYTSLEKLEEEINVNPNFFTAWFKIALPELQHHLAKNPTLRKM